MTNDVALLNETLSSLKAKGFDTIILGDFNADTRRGNQRTKTFLDFVINNNLRALDVETPQEISYTFSRASSQSWIDHVLYHRDSTNAKDAKIERDLINRSDHNAISIK
jgi:endonuclease/exonuclease/phosphatase family metal-dependent hydrolase